MKFTQTKLSGAYLITLTPHIDSRGEFARTFCQEEFGKVGIAFEVAQANVSKNIYKGTLRGMHYQMPPFEEAKVVRCDRGTIFDVIIDLRPQSKTYKEWIGVELSESNNKMLYVPKGFAHGFQTLSDSTEISYLLSEFYHPEAELGIRYDDKEFAIQWPLPVSHISERDTLHKDFTENL